ncbi:MAG: hypothetical protein A2Y24_03715 [Clostridiales bacterium GWE2_32_10]|nr:MAG: hypothetical protein A2Y24_03715 [Clostridiales bacterium GWE2_32_10]HBY21499.1 YggT family protein [Clostridiales bacterium]
MINIMIRAVDIFFTVLSTLIFIRVILSWVGYSNTDKRIKLLYDVTDPVLEPFRKLLDRWQSNTMIDFSPILALFFLHFLENVIIYLISAM